MRILSYLVFPTILIIALSFTRIAQVQPAIATATPLGTAAATSEAGQPCFLVISDVHLSDTQHQADIPDDPTYSNSGTDLWQAARDKMSEVLNHHKPTFLIICGDLPKHGAEADEAKREISTVLSALRDSAQRYGMPFIFVPGNNDIPGHHNGTFSVAEFAAYTGSHGSWAMAGGNTVQYPRDAKISDLGYYSIWPLADRKLRVIVLNTVIYLSKTTDTAQLLWLSGQLHDAQTNGEKVLLTMHVPPGTNYKGKPSWKGSDICMQNTFMRTIAPYKAIIAGIITSHTHMEGIKIYQDASGHFMDPGLSIPGIATGHGNYPAMELVSYDSSFEVSDLLTFYHRYHSGEAVQQWGTDSVWFFRDIAQARPGAIRGFLDSISTHSPDIIYALQKRIDDLLNEPGNDDDDPGIVSVGYGCK